MKICFFDIETVPTEPSFRKTVSSKSKSGLTKRNY